MERQSLVRLLAMPRLPPDGDRPHLGGIEHIEHRLPVRAGLPASAWVRSLTPAASPHTAAASAPPYRNRRTSGRRRCRVHGAGGSAQHAHIGSSGDPQGCTERRRRTGARGGGPDMAPSSSTARPDAGRLRPSRERNIGIVDFPGGLRLAWRSAPLPNSRERCPGLRHRPEPLPRSSVVPAHLRADAPRGNGVPVADAALPRVPGARTIRRMPRGRMRTPGGRGLGLPASPPLAPETSADLEMG